MDTDDDDDEDEMETDHDADPTYKCNLEKSTDTFVPLDKDQVFLGTMGGIVELINALNKVN
jgi:hypothetical protein